jgi:hypothetical protein
LYITLRLRNLDAARYSIDLNETDGIAHDHASAQTFDLRFAFDAANGEAGREPFKNDVGSGRNSDIEISA